MNKVGTHILSSTFYLFEWAVVCGAGICEVNVAAQAVIRVFSLS